MSGPSEHFTWDEVGLSPYKAHIAKANATKLAKDYLEPLRAAVGEPLKINSWYRSPRHPKERDKKKPGYHTKGLAVDIACHGDTAFKINMLAPLLGFQGMGIHQGGARSGRYIHLDIGDRRAIWTY